MKLNELKPAAGAIKSAWRKGQGPGSGNGKTAGRGQKGQHSRTGSKHRPGFEGGQMPLHRRLPKRGFTNFTRKEYSVVNIETIARVLPEGGELSLELALKLGLLKAGRAGLKVLGDGEVVKATVVHAHKASASARAKLEKVGGRVEIVVAQPPARNS